MLRPHALPLDCAPFAAPVEARLSAADLRRIESLQRELLRPLDYETVDAWRAAGNRSLVAALGGAAAMFQLELPGIVQHFTADLDTDILSGYPDIMPDLARTKQVYSRAARLGAGNRYTLWEPHLEWLYDSAYFNEFIVDLRAFDTLWASAPVDGAKYPAMLHTYHDRPDGSERFGAVDIQLMRLTQPALEAGVRMVRQLHRSRATLTRAVDHLGDAVFAFTLDGELIHRNPRASAVAEAPGGELVSSHAAELARRLGQRRGPVEPDAMRRRIMTPAARYTATAALLAAGLLGPQAAVLVTLSVQTDRLPTQKEVRRRFDLTRRQAEVALLLARRLTNSEIAERLVISPHTALRHTEATMAGLGVSDRRRVAERLRDAAPEAQG